MNQAPSSKHRSAENSPLLPSRRPYTSARREEQKQVTRLRVLRRALVHFSEHGFDGASLREIATEAEVTHTVIGRHFGGKEELWRAAIDLMFEHQDEQLGDEWNNLDHLTATSFRTLVFRYVEYCAGHPEHVRVMIHETLRESDRVSWLVDTHIKRRQIPLVRLLQKAIKDGLLVDMPITSMIYIFTASAQMIFALGREARYLHGLDVSTPSVIEEHASAISAMLLRRE